MTRSAAGQTHTLDTTRKPSVCRTKISVSLNGIRNENLQLKPDLLIGQKIAETDPHFSKTCVPTFTQISLQKDCPVLEQGCHLDSSICDRCRVKAFDPTAIAKMT
jgi:hypothetical protein